MDGEGLYLGCPRKPPAPSLLSVLGCKDTDPRAAGQVSLVFSSVPGTHGSEKSYIR